MGTQSVGDNFYIQILVVFTIKHLNGILTYRLQYHNYFHLTLADLCIYFCLFILEKERGKVHRLHSTFTPNFLNPYNYVKND